MRIRFPRNASHLRTAGTLLQRTIAVVLLFGLLLGIAGVPVVTVTKKDRSRPYPCQDHACGCASADECWHHCCCFTNQQKLAWAHEHGVTPPDFVIAAAEREETDTVAADDDHAADDHGDCQDKHGACACCAKRAGHAEEPACCQQRHAHRHLADKGDGRDRQPQTPGKSPASVKFVLSDLARRCGGMQSVISFLCDALPFVDRPQWKPVESLVEYLVDVPVTCASAELAPPVPPPKLAGGLAA